MTENDLRTQLLLLDFISIPRAIMYPNSWLMRHKHCDVMRSNHTSYIAIFCPILEMQTTYYENYSAVMKRVLRILEEIK